MTDSLLELLRQSNFYLLLVAYGPTRLRPPSGPIPDAYSSLAQHQPPSRLPAAVSPTVNRPRNTKPAPRQLCCSTSRYCCLPSTNAQLKRQLLMILLREFLARAILSYPCKQIPPDRPMSLFHPDICCSHPASTLSAAFRGRRLQRKTSAPAAASATKLDVIFCFCNRFLLTFHFLL